MDETRSSHRTSAQACICGVLLALAKTNIFWVVPPGTYNQVSSPLPNVLFGMASTGLIGPYVWRLTAASDARLRVATRLTWWLLFLTPPLSAALFMDGYLRYAVLGLWTALAAATPFARSEPLRFEVERKALFFGAALALVLLTLMVFAMWDSTISNYPSPISPTTITAIPWALPAAAYLSLRGVGSPTNARGPLPLPAITFERALTAAAVVLALYSAQLSSQANRLDREARETLQAEQVVVVEREETGFGIENRVITVENYARLPIQQLTIVRDEDVPYDGTALNDSEFADFIPERSIFIGDLRSCQAVRVTGRALRRFADYSTDGSYSTGGQSVVFEDAAGQGWNRSGEGPPQRIDYDPLGDTPNSPYKRYAIPDCEPS